MSTPAISARVRKEALHDGAQWAVELAAPPANVLDRAMIAQLTEVFHEAAATPGLKAVRLSGEGAHFSYGASVAEHRPSEVADMLAAFNGLFSAISAAAVPVLAVVRGRCLGGGLELAAFCHRVFAAPDSQLGQPEIVLGVLAPAASALLPHRIGQRHTDDLCLSGRTTDGAEAHGMGLVDEIALDPAAAADAWFSRHLSRHSASSLRFATRAARIDFVRRFERDVADLTHLYLDELMQTADAVEGITAFLEKRKPVWSDS
jgi:cyclohexa-1,5-dienecarbonyl-CoA hydratase